MCAISLLQEMYIQSIYCCNATKPHTDIASLHLNLKVARFTEGPEFHLDHVVAKQRDWLEEADSGRHCAASVFLCHHGVVLLLLPVEVEHRVVLHKCTLSAGLVMVSNWLWWLLGPAGVREVRRMAVILCTVYSLWINNIYSWIYSKTLILQSCILCSL